MSNKAGSLCTRKQISQIQGSLNFPSSAGIRTIKPCSLSGLCLPLLVYKIWIIVLPPSSLVGRLCRQMLSYLRNVVKENLFMNIKEYCCCLGPKYSNFILFDAIRFQHIFSPVVKNIQLKISTKGHLFLGWLYEGPCHGSLGEEVEAC